MTASRPDDAALLDRGLLGFGEALALLGRHGPGAQEVRRPAALGARVPWAADNHWADAVVVTDGAPVAADTDLPHCLWSTAATVSGHHRVHPEVAMPVMGLELAASSPADSGAVADVGRDELGVLNDLAYGQEVLGPLLAALPAGTGRCFGVRDHGGRLVSAALALEVDDDSSVQWVATHPDHRRRGHARRVLESLLADARQRGQATATLQSSSDGYRLYEQLGFRAVGTLRAHIRA